jgi:hypothetical protein
MAGLIASVATNDKKPNKPVVSEFDWGKSYLFRHAKDGDSPRPKVECIEQAANENPSAHCQAPSFSAAHSFAPFCLTPLDFDGDLGRHNTLREISFVNPLQS